MQEEATPLLTQPSPHQQSPGPETDPEDHAAATHAAIEAMEYKPPVPRWALHRRLYNWTLELSERKHATWALFGISFAESSFFPVPPDVLLAPLCLGNRKKAMWFATVCTLGSVLGGILGYAIGFFLWESIQTQMYAYVPGFSEEKFLDAKGLYDTYGVWILFAAAFTIIPFKAFTIAAGVFSQALLPFILVSTIGRGLRFYLVAGLFWWIGPKAERFIDKYFNLLCISMFVLAIVGIAILKMIH